jgi:hypothetical protein
MSTPTSNFSKVQDRVFIGNGFDACNAALIAEHGITAIVSVALEFHPDAVDTIYRCGLHDEFPDHPVNTDEQLRAAVDSFEMAYNAGHVVLSHCAAGHNRSVATVVGWLVKSGRCRTVNDAYTYVRDRHESDLQPILKAHLARLYDPTT